MSQNKPYCKINLFLETVLLADNFIRSIFALLFKHDL